MRACCHVWHIQPGMSLRKFDADLRRWLKTQKKPLEQVAEESGLSVRWLYRYQSGKCNPTLRNLVALWEYANR